MNSIFSCDCRVQTAPLLFSTPLHMLWNILLTHCLTLCTSSALGLGPHCLALLSLSSFSFSFPWLLRIAVILDRDTLQVLFFLFFFLEREGTFGLFAELRYPVAQGSILQEFLNVALGRGNSSNLPTGSYFLRVQMIGRWLPQKKIDNPAFLQLCLQGNL